MYSIFYFEIKKLKKIVYGNSGHLTTAVYAVLVKLEAILKRMGFIDKEEGTLMRLGNTDRPPLAFNGKPTTYDAVLKHMYFKG